MPTAKTLEKLAVLWTVLVPDDKIRTKITDKTLTQLLILPDEALARVPFETLVVKWEAENPVYLLDVGPATIYAPSASMYYNLSRRNVETKTAKVLTAGNPDYSSSHLTEKHNFRYPQLPWTEMETKWIEESCRRNNIAVTRFNLDQSTEENVRQNVAGKSIVHFAGHSLAGGEHGDPFSALLLTVGNQNDLKDDGSLELAEMFSLDLRSCELTVLSAVSTNLGSNQYGKETWSMGTACLASGAKRVVATDWSIDDEASARLVSFFIDTINESIGASSKPDYAVALRQAKREIRNDRDHPQWRHPFYWAPFVLIGPN
jgi:CHAT domain-containing protein